MGADRSRPRKVGIASGRCRKGYRWGWMQKNRVLIVAGALARCAYS
jgi:hypothetical protein